VWSIPVVIQPGARRLLSPCLVPLGLLAVLCWACPAGPARSQQPSPQPPPPSMSDTHGIIELETEEASGGSVAIAEDLASIVDNSSTRRLLPVVGNSAQQNLVDLMRLGGIALAILPTDVLDASRRQNLYPDLEHQVSYVTVLYSQELHLLARTDIRRLADLTGRTVNVGVIGSGTALTAGRLFGLLGISATLTYDRQRPALEKLRQGEIQALALVAPRPAPLFLGIRPEEHLHFVPVPLESSVINTYVPTKLDPADYPNLVRPGESVDTIAVATVLAAGKSEPGSARDRDLAGFVNAFFSQVGVLLQPGHHPKWQEVNLAATFPGWNRLPAAQQWLERNGAVPPGQSPAPAETSVVTSPPALTMPASPPPASVMMSPGVMSPGQPSSVTTPSTPPEATVTDDAQTATKQAEPKSSEPTAPKQKTEAKVEPNAEAKAEPGTEDQTESRATQKTDDADLRARFARFLDAHRQTLGANMTPAQKQELFQQFKRWRAAQER
jgi:TRAP-type uncharacterized transport system substrate-binding protein